MRYIDYGDSKPSQDWLDKAEKYTKELKNISIHAERKIYINNRSQFWSKLKEDFLLDIFHHKCCFSEAIDEVSDYHIEHFRPKLKVQKLKFSTPKFSEAERTTWRATEKDNKDTGYWWLAFDWTNYLISGSKINSTYKQNYFPLKNGSFMEVLLLIKVSKKLRMKMLFC